MRGAPDYARLRQRKPSCGGVGGGLEVDTWDGKVNRKSLVVRNVDRLAYSCRGILNGAVVEALVLWRRELRWRIKVFMRGSLDHFFYACIIFDIYFKSPNASVIQPDPHQQSNDSDRLLTEASYSPEVTDHL